ncbi:MAG: hypothetical protein HJJLKODD_02187 [Phycisphaerae bacterium]|nr:hypothetical protein [Phycisphaerae bacterium]
MAIFLDDQPYRTQLGAASSIQQLVEEIRPQLSESRRLIVTITCDQQPIAEENIAAVMGQNINHYERVDLATVSIPDIAVAALDEGMKLIAASRLQQPEIVSALNGGQREQIFTTLRTCLEAWAQSHDLVSKILQLLQPPLEQLPDQGNHVTSALQAMTSQLTQIKDALQAGDWVMLNDLIRFDMPPVLDQWSVMLQELRDWCLKSPSP